MESQKNTTSLGRMRNSYFCKSWLLTSTLIKKKRLFLIDPGTNTNYIFIGKSSGFCFILSGTFPETFFQWHFACSSAITVVVRSSGYSGFLVIADATDEGTIQLPISIYQLLYRRCAIYINVTN